MTAVSEVFGLLFGLQSGRSVLALLRAYFDESGTHGDAEVTAICGYVADESAWTKFETEWRAALGDFGLEYVHLTELLAGEGEFARVRRVLEPLLTRLGRIIAESGVSPVSVGVHARIWEAVTTPEFRAVFPKPYDLCFSLTIRNLRAWSDSYAIGKRIGLVFASQDEYEQRNSETLKAWHRYGADRIGPLAFDSPRKLPALQTADFLANQYYAAWTEFAAGRTPPGKLLINSLFRDLMRNDDEVSSFLGEKALRLFVANRDWLDPYFSCPKQ